MNLVEKLNTKTLKMKKQWPNNGIEYNGNEKLFMAKIERQTHTHTERERIIKGCDISETVERH